MLSSLILTFLQCIASDCKNSCIVYFFCPLNQISCFCVITASACAFLNFISKRPHNDRWRILTSSNCRFQIKFRPSHTIFSTQDFVSFLDCFIKPCSIVIGVTVFMIHPTVKELIDYNHSFFIADINQRRCCRVVCHTDRVTSHFLQNFHLTFNSASVRFSS